MSVKCKKSSEDYFLLKPTIEPYLFFPILLLIVFAANIPYIQRTGDWGSVGIFAFLFLIYSWIPYMGMRYRIWWQGGRVFQRSGDMIVSSMAIGEIKKIKQEYSDLATLAAYNRPSKRITLYGETIDGPKEIYVSLVHFKIEDVKKLMKIIHNKRPNLEMPKGWG